MGLAKYLPIWPQIMILLITASQSGQDCRCEPPAPTHFFTVTVWQFPACSQPWATIASVNIHTRANGFIIQMSWVSGQVPSIFCSLTTIATFKSIRHLLNAWQCFQMKHNSLRLSNVFVT
jgi:hypothetical protein